MCASDKFNIIGTPVIINNYNTGFSYVTNDVGPTLWNGTSEAGVESIMSATRKCKLIINNMTTNITVLCCQQQMCYPSEVVVG